MFKLMKLPRCCCKSIRGVSFSLALLLLITDVPYCQEREDVKKALPVQNADNKGYIEVRPEAVDHALISAPLAIPVSPEYVIDPPDSISITVKDEPTLTKAATLRPDGRILYPLLGEIFVQGYTSRELEEKLRTELRKFYKEELDIAVEITGFNSKFIYVVGESGPTALSYRGNQRILDVLLGAGYVPKIGAKIDAIKIVRMDQRFPDNPKFFTVDLNKLVLDGDIRQNVFLQSGDIVRVPATILRRINYGLSTIMEPVGPILTGATTASALYNLKNQFAGDNSGGTTVVAPVITTSNLTNGSSSLSTGSTNNTGS